MQNSEIYTKFSPKQVKAIDLLAKGGLTNEQVFNAVGVSNRTFYTWKLRQDFREAVVARSRELLQEELPNLYKVAVQKANKGSYQHLKILLDHMDKIEGHFGRSEDSITFTWK